MIVSVIQNSLSNSRNVRTLDVYVVTVLFLCRLGVEEVKGTTPLCCSWPGEGTTDAFHPWVSPELVSVALVWDSRRCGMFGADAGSFQM